MEEMFQNVIHSDGSLFREVVHHFIYLITTFSALELVFWSCASSAS